MGIFTTQQNLWFSVQRSFNSVKYQGYDGFIVDSKTLKNI